MPRGAVESKELSASERDVFYLCMMLLGVLYDGDVLAVVAKDDRGVFIHARPGKEAAIMEYLKGVDWGKAVMLAQEHVP